MAQYAVEHGLLDLEGSRADESVSPPGSRGEYLARAGDCVACHSVPGGKAFAGGLKMGTPLGAIYSTNITPDPYTSCGCSHSLAGQMLIVPPPKLTSPG